MRLWIAGGVLFGAVLAVAAIAAGPSDFQRNILEDGYVSFEEYREAVSATVSCIRGYGLPTSEPEQSENGILLVFDILSPEGMSAEQSKLIDEAYSACADRYLDDVAWAYIQLNLPSGEQRREMVQAFAKCVSSATGIEVASDLAPVYIADIASRASMSASMSVDSSSAASGCLMRYEILFIQEVE